LIAALSIAALALAICLTTPPTQRAASNAVDGGTLPAKVVRRDAQACKRIVAQYEYELAALRTCDADSDCTVEDRTNLFATLDGCYRIVSRAAPKGEVDRLAAAWLSGGCMLDVPSCERAHIPACRQRTCAERPPPGVPEDWHRERVPGVITMFLPSDLHRTEAQGEDSFVLSYQGMRRSIAMEIGVYSPDPSPDAHLESAPWDKLLSTRSLVVAGRPTTLFLYQLASSSRRSSFAADARVSDVAGPVGSIASRAPSTLFFSLDCETNEACAIAPTILGSLEVLSETIAR
jgi:hypothetical protein